MNDQRFTVYGDVTADKMVVGHDNHNVFYSGQASPAPGWTDPSRENPVFGIVTALPVEFAAVRAVLDDPRGPQTVTGDRALYVLGTLPSRDDERPHPVVLTLLGDTGNSAAAESCANLIRSFPTVDIVVMCGIACGVP